MPDSKVVNRICEFIDKIHDSRQDAILWDLSMFEENGGVIISFLKELARRELVLQVDKIFRHDSYRHPLVNELQCNPMIEDEFNELFNILPKEYQSELRGEIISYREGDKDYTYPLIGGTALMGF